MKGRSIMRSSATISVLLHVVIFGLLGVSFASCTGPVERSAEAPPRVIQAAAVAPREVETYYRERRAREREQLEARERERRQRLEQERRRAEAAANKRREQRAREQAARERRQALLQKEKREAAEARRLQEQVKRREAERKAEAERQRKEQEARRKAEEERLRKAEEERLRKAEEERLRKEREARRKAEAEAERLRKEREARRLAEEQQRLKMRKRQRALWTRQYAGLLRASIERHWKKPPSSVRGGDCVLKLRQDESGTVLDLNVVSCDGDRLFVRSVEEAVWKASPLPAPPSPEVFDANVELTFRQKY